MPPQIQTPKQLLLSQAELPRVALGATPLAGLGEGVSGVLASLAQNLPETPALPALAAPVPGALGNVPSPPRVSQLFQSIEATLPALSPRLSTISQAFEGSLAQGEPGVIGPKLTALPPPEGAQVIKIGV